MLRRLQAALGNWCASVSPVGSTVHLFTLPDNRYPIPIQMRWSPLSDSNALSEEVCHCIFPPLLSTKSNLAPCHGSPPAMSCMLSPFLGLLLCLSRGTYVKCNDAGRIAGCAATIIPNTCASYLTGPDLGNRICLLPSVGISTSDLVGKWSSYSNPTQKQKLHHLIQVCFTFFMLLQLVSLVL